MPGALRLPSPGHRRAARRRILGWAAVLVAVLVVQRTTSAAEHARAEWVGPRPAVVVRSAVGAGHRIGSDDVTTVRLPTGLTPSDALRSVPEGATASIELRPGTVLGRSMLAESGRSPTARALEPGRVAVVVRTGGTPAPAVPGDLVDVTAPGWDAPVARSARVVAISGDAVTLAVREQDATPTATAGLEGPVALVLRP